MSDKIRIDVGGIKKDIEEIETGLRPETIRTWCRGIGSLAKNRCEGGVSLTPREAAPRRVEIMAKYGSKGELDCLVGLIEENLHRMPKTTRALFEQLLRNLYRKQSSSPAYG